MKKFMTIMVLLILAIVNLYSADKQFYFIGKYGRLGSISNEANMQTGIYLRWDLIEGSLPSDIKKIKLIRVYDNRTVLDVDSNDKMSAKQIGDMFQSVGSQRRLFEIINSISKNDNPQCTNANLGNIGTKVLSCLQDNYWSFLASRVNFDIARARYRAYIDNSFDKKRQYIDYILVGIANNQQQITLGKTRVELKPTMVLSANDFKQVIESKCNDNRYGLDDYRVGLSWKNGGANSTEFFANGLMVSGYDLYYSTKPAKELDSTFPTTIDMIKIASTINHNSIGELNPKTLRDNFNIAKANETLITIGEKDVDGEKPLYIESMQTLKDRGFKPNENRYYFLVARDFTGNYGETIYLKVKIPDLLPPAKPINPRVIEDNNKTTLLWDSVTPQNYLSYYRDMKACPNRVNKRIKFVAKDETCQKDTGVTLNFNVSQYYIYRFDNQKNAVQFEDKNLNGISDVLEELNSTTCKPKRNLLRYNRLVEKIPQSNKKSIKFHDNDVIKSKEYWYRIVSVTDRNITSHFTIPIRAFVPNRELIDAPEFNVTTKKLVIKLEANNDDNERGYFINNLTSKVKKVKLEYSNGIFEFPIKSNDFTELGDTPLNDYMFSTDTGIVFISFFDERNRLLRTYFNDSSKLFNFIDIQDPKDKYKIIGHKISSVKNRLEIYIKDVEIKDGEAIPSECVDIHFDTSYFNQFMNNKKMCTEINLAMGSKRYKLIQDCNVTQIKKVCAKKSTHDLYSIGVSTHYDNGQMSYPSYFNFIPNRDKLPKPNKPAIVDLKVKKTLKQAIVSIKPQIEKVTGTMLYLYNRDKNISQIKMVPHIDKHDPQKLILAELNITNINIPDTWCIKGKTIGVDGQVSDWSNIVCEDLNIKQQQDDLLAWPILKNSVFKGDDLNISFTENQIKIKLLDTYIHKNQCDYFYELKNHLNFVVYRSTIIDDSNHTKFVQISPLIDNPKPNECINDKVFNNKDNLDIEYFDDDTKARINYIDKYPYIVGEKYQYVVLFFNSDGEVSSYSLTNPAIIQIH